MSQQHPVTTAELIYQVGQLEGKIIQQRLTDIGIRMDHARLLHYVSDVPGTNQVDLAKYLNVQPATLTNMIKKLEQQNLIIRRISPTDSHMKQIFLLPKGEVAARKINDVFNQLNQIVASVDLKNPEQFQQLVKLLELKYQE
ncbi:MarR family transcriptional regulator [Lactiplantibacillus sp. WILCCON 0030]|uniref:MarR family transcriptional regulator n=1 Tax=Lactiplantibacillus brownii TaxID=3069269 RepID=A0ABU1A8W5_9LACO|nr:MarR family transcriptional regulator [Lactiplantibacillus brownii]MDQ7937403.1 MarR family transcriptional regulator [Lactiplantibacillus brownii]